MGDLVTDLSAGADRLWQTHISWVFGVGDQVFKVKRPVSLGFLDFSTLALRKEACEAEVVLNTRLAPDVYRSVVPITRDASGRHAIDGDGEVVDWAVRMRRLPEHARADSRLAAGTLGIAEVDAMARRIAAFHAASRSDAATAAFGRPDAIGVNVRENFEQTRGVIEALLGAEEAHEIESWQLGFLAEEAARFHARAEGGRVRDGHGDLRLEHFYLEPDGEVRVLDCIEFNERFRFADVASDIAFLSMDLAFHGRVDLAERALATYAQETSDYDLFPLVDFYESYRAYVRGKISAIVAGDEGCPTELRERARREARRYFLLSLASERRSPMPATLVAIGGPIASGKSTLADQLGAAMGAPAINTDRIRKHMIGAGATDKLYDGSWAGAYDPEFTERVYEEVERLAKAVLASGRSVILDASFRSRSMRADAKRVATEAGARFRFVECRVDPRICKARLRVRDKQTSVSDGRLEIFDDFMKKWEAVEELPAEEHLVVDTAREMEGVVESLRPHLPLWPEDLTS
ncbi:MAG: AAA family ATPase [Myxococcales bacterium]|nr:AAA family ATPase [Myxococcales bacterium]